MIVQDNNFTPNGAKDSLTVMILFAELDMLLAGHILTGCNMHQAGAKVSIRNSAITKATQIENGLVVIEITRVDLRCLRESGHHRRMFCVDGKTVDSVYLFIVSEFELSQAC